MLTYALDEYGDFEGIKNVNEPVYIGGLIYDDHSAQGEERNERRRVRSYYEAVIKDAATEARIEITASDNDRYKEYYKSVTASDFDDSLKSEGFLYPEALHSNGKSIRDHIIVRHVKEIVKISLAEFIKFGTYRGNKLRYRDNSGITRDFYTRKGDYHIFVILKSDKGMKKLLNQNANILAKDDYASNLYFHMADVLISRLIFYNPIIDDIEEISLDIATRKSADLTNDDRLFREYKAQGYKAEQTQEGKYFFRLTNPDIYRTVIAEEILDADKPNIKITRFNINSISYHSYGSRDMEFLYLSDSICSILGFDIDGNNADDWLNCIVRRVSEITGKKENLVFGYDEIDNIYFKALAKSLDGDYYKALSIAFDAGKYEGTFSEYYKNLWFKKIEEKIVKSAGVSEFNMAVRKLNETLNNNTLDQDKCFYILGVLESIVPKIKRCFHSPEAKKILYTLYDIGVTASCHIGDSKRAEEYFKKCTAYSDLADLDDYLNTRNKMVVFHCDYFDFDKAEKLSDENLTYQELLTELKNDLKLPVPDNAGFHSLGKVHSQKGQVCAFRRDKHAEEEFMKALTNFEKGSANYKITQSYLLHYYLDTNNYEAYSAESKEYFGGEEKLSEQLKYILDEGSKSDPLINMKYAMYVFVRALYLFRLSELTDKVWSELKNAETKFKNKIGKNEWKLTGHPSELIFKYMRLIALSKNEAELEKQYSQRMEDCLIYHGITEDVIRKFGELEVLNKKENITGRDRLSLELFRDLADNFPAFEGSDIPQGGEERYHLLCNKITFMYR